MSHPAFLFFYLHLQTRIIYFASKSKHWTLAEFRKCNSIETIIMSTGCFRSQKHIVQTWHWRLWLRIFTFGYVGLEVEGSELIHALFGLWGFGRLLFTLWLLRDTHKQAMDELCSPVQALPVYQVINRAQFTEGSSWSVFSIHVSKDCRSLGPWYLTASWSGLNSFSLDITHKGKN